MTSILFLCVYFLAVFLGFHQVNGDLKEPTINSITVRETQKIQKVLLNTLHAKNSFDVPLYSMMGYDDLDLSEPCKSHAVLYGSSMTDEQWAMDMFDSITKVPEGVLMGTTYHLGNYDECINVRDVTTDNGTFNGQHCLAALHIRTQQQMDRSSPEMTALSLNIAKCIPSTCNARDAELIANRDLETMTSILNDTSINISATVNGDLCSTADSPDYTTEDWIAISILIFFAVVVILSTGYDILLTEKESRSNLATAFSVYTNGKKLLSTSKSGDVLHCLHGIRFISMCWIVFGHRFASATMLPSSNYLTWFQNLVPNWKYLWVMNANLSVDTFFFLSGLVCAYVFFKTVPRTNSFNIILYYVHRYIRLTPALAIMMMIESTLFKHFGSGPLWTSAVERAHKPCADKWWTNLLYINNYVDTTQQCLAQSWYLPVDMQLHWLSPLVLVPLWKRPRIGWILMGVLMIAGLITNFVIAYVNEFPGPNVNIRPIGNSEGMDKNILWPVWTRFMPYLIGVALGNLLVDIKTKGRKIEFTKKISICMWLLGGALMVFALCIIQVFYQTDYEYEPVWSSLYNAFGRPIWASGVAIVVFLCATGHGGFPNTILSCTMFQVLSRLCYSIYLVHVSFQLVTIGSTKYIVRIDEFLVVSQFIVDIAFSIIFATLLCLVFESPFIVLEKELFGGKKKPTTNPKPVIADSTLHEVESNIVPAGDTSVVEDNETLPEKKPPEDVAKM